MLECESWSSPKKEEFSLLCRGMSLTPTGSPAGVTFGAMPDGDYSPNTLQRERVQVRLEEFDIEGENASLLP